MHVAQFAWVDVHTIRSYEGMKVPPNVLFVWMREREREIGQSEGHYPEIEHQMRTIQKRPNAHILGSELIHFISTRFGEMKRDTHSPLCETICHFICCHCIVHYVVSRGIVSHPFVSYCISLVINMVP